MQRFSRILFASIGVLTLAVASIRAADDGETKRVPALSEDYYKSGKTLLTVFKPVSTATRDSVAIIRSGTTRIALATIVDANGYLITKASELKPGRLTASLSNGSQFEATVVATDEDSDLALLHIPTRGLRPVQWDPARIAIGEWIATPGIEATPEAVGIVSVNVREIPRERAIMGIKLRTADPASGKPAPAVIDEVTPGFGAAEAGLKKGDLVTKLGGVTVSNYDELTARMRAFRAGDLIEVELDRDSERIVLPVKLTAESVVLTAEQKRAGRPDLRSDRMNKMGSAVSERSKDFASVIQHDTVLEPWQCGGPLVGLNGKAIGINIARAGRVASYALPASLVKDVVAKLMAKSTAPQVAQR